MDADDLRTGVERVQRDPLHPVAGVRSLAASEIRVVHADVHPKGSGPGGDAAPHLPKADEPQRLAAKLPADKARPLPPALPRGTVGGQDRPGQSDHQSHGQLGDGGRVAPGSKGDNDAPLLGRGKIDVVQARPGPPDHP